MKAPTINQTSAPPVIESERPAVRAESIGQPPAAPVQTDVAVKPPPSPDEVRQALKDINASMRAMSRDLEFSLDPESDRVIVRVVDQQTKEVIRQMPTKEALEIAKAIDRSQGLLISQRV